MIAKTEIFEQLLEQQAQYNKNARLENNRTIKSSDK